MIMSNLAGTAASAHAALHRAFAITLGGLQGNKIFATRQKMMRGKLGRGNFRQRGMQNVYVGRMAASESAELTRNGEMNVADVNRMRRKLTSIALNPSGGGDSSVGGDRKYSYTSAEELGQRLGLKCRRGASKSSPMQFRTKGWHRRKKGHCMQNPSADHATQTFWEGDGVSAVVVRGLYTMMSGQDRGGDGYDHAVTLAFPCLSLAVCE